MTDDAAPEPFLRSQGMELLTDRADPFRHLTLAALRQRRGMPTGSPDATAQSPSVWEPLDRDQLVQRLVGDGEGQDDRWLRVAFTGDAGLGKTLNLKELAFEINGGLALVPGLDPVPSHSTRSVAFLIRLQTMPAVTNQDFERCVLLPEFRLTDQTGVESLDDDRALLLLRRLRDQGRIVLLFDELDQVGAVGPAVGALETLLKNPRWQGCPIVLAGRPYAMSRCRKTLFDPFLAQWRFVSLDEFRVEEQQIMLGRTADGREERYELIHEEAREILAVPRVLEYLRKLDDQTLRAIRTPSDVYWQAVKKLLPADMERSAEAKKIGRPAHDQPEHVSRQSLDWAKQLLGALAYEMTIQTVCDEDGVARPNFRRVPLKAGKDSQFRDYLDSVCRRVKKDGTDEQQRCFHSDLDKLAALNDFLENAFLDAESPQGLTQVLWRNRTLQEFFTAWWLANFCAHPKAKHLWEEEDAQRLWDWIYLPYEPLTEEYYWVWRFLTEMPDEACDDDCWVHAVEPLFWPGGGDPAKTRRSCEMIHRAWPRLETLRDDPEAPHEGARQVLAVFQGEFEQIRAGRQGDDRQRSARDFVGHFQRVEAGTFRMGTPDERQGWGEEVREAHRRWLQKGRDDPEGHAKAFYADVPVPPGKAAKTLREQTEADLASIIQTQNLAELENWWAPHDETPADNPADDWTNPAIGAFLLNRYPTLNAWYRLFDPEHGTRGGFYESVYQRVSPTPEHPVIFVSWYEAWVFCRWAYWDGRDCRLPHEDEWEYVAKAGTPWDRKRWWGDEDEPLAEHCTFGQAYDKGSTTAPSGFDPREPEPRGDHSNPWGFVDMLGNVWEWTDDLYRRQYTRADREPESSARVLRGGSWANPPDYVRSGVRGHNRPTIVDGGIGFRVARALP